MLYVPRPHQAECLEVLKNVRLSGIFRALVVMASSLGKTVLAAFDAAEVLSTRPGRVLYLCDRSTHFPMAMSTFMSILGDGYTYGYFSGGNKDADADVLFATFQTMRNHLHLFAKDEFVYIVVDESHHTYASTYLPTVLHFRPHFLLGLTATPDRLDMQDIREVFGKEVYSLPLPEAMAQGLTAPVDYRLLTDEITNLDFLDTPIGQLSIGELNKTLFVPKRDEEIARSIERRVDHLESVRGIVFCETVAHCFRMEELLPGSTVLHADIKGEKRKDLIEAFERGNHRFLITVNVLNEAVDVPSVNVLVFLRNTVSLRIFLQQLGRGLRGDDTVLVLDFVANCERLVMLRDLRDQVQERLLPVAEGGGGVYHDPISLDWGHIHFSEEIVQIIDVLDKLFAGYTRELVLELLRKLAGRLGRAPTSQEYVEAVSRREVPSYSVLRRFFPGYPDALRAAGYTPPFPGSWTKGEYIAYLQSMAEDLGRVPLTRDIRERALAGKGPHAASIRSKFGSYADALRAAGMEPHRLPNITKEEVLAEYRALGEDLGKVPRLLDVDEARARGFDISRDSIAYSWGNVGNLRKALGFDQRVPDYSKEELISHLRKAEARLGRVPTSKDMNALSREDSGTFAFGRTFTLRFGSFSEALRVAGMMPAVRDRSDEEILDELRAYAVELGYTPSTTEITKACQEGVLTYSPQALLSRFGTFINAVRAANLVPRTAQTEDEILSTLVTLVEDLGRMPSPEDVADANRQHKCTSAATIKRRFGSWDEAMSQLRLRLIAEDKGEEE